MLSGSIFLSGTKFFVDPPDLPEALEKAGKPLLADPLAEDWLPSFTLQEAGAMINPSARLHDAVVLRGATVEAGAVVVRSIVCPGGVVRKDRTAVDQLVTQS